MECVEDRRDATRRAVAGDHIHASVVSKPMCNSVRVHQWCLSPVTLKGIFVKALGRVRLKESLGRNVHLVYETGNCRQSVLSQVCFGFVLTARDRRVYSIFTQFVGR